MDQYMQAYGPIQKKNASAVGPHVSGIKSGYITFYTGIKSLFENLKHQGPRHQGNGSDKCMEEWSIVA